MEQISKKGVFFMFNPGKIKDLYNLKKQADEMKREMEKIVVEVEEKGVKIVMQGDQKVVSVMVDGEDSPKLKDVFNKAVKESQKKTAKKMQGRLSDLGLGF
ncbi:YbaB/EbfC family nucleoid-associated protein [Patescibacteria group bacterium]|nr:YbaB/EbfC family nucleoid-associated protein [Patescibacteria group bacterium]